MVEHSPDFPKVKGSSPGTEREEMENVGKFVLIVLYIVSVPTNNSPESPS